MIWKTSQVSLIPSTSLSRPCPKLRQDSIPTAKPLSFTKSTTSNPTFVSFLFDHLQVRFTMITTNFDTISDKHKTRLFTIIPDNTFAWYTMRTKRDCVQNVIVFTIERDHIVKFVELSFVVQTHLMWITQWFVVIRQSHSKSRPRNPSFCNTSNLGELAPGDLRMNRKYVAVEEAEDRR